MSRNPRRGGRASRAVEACVLWLIRAYQVAISPLMGAHCRHVPSCSAYARTAVERFGALGGGALALRRLARCHPWGTAGYDPVPDAPNASDPGRPSVEP